ncbi:MAG: tRNA (guanosine(37)-N1)-methyltransferase TrmD [Candidatus Peribacteria bacterium]|jgi:tRNA (guanine37-N1)-methyltransferase|nr:tRNA (guanosine(37)-N1)-methyltransferase TrmD [Candidatus Peribacteria bacterium]
MQFYIISLFPEIFTSFLSTSLLQKAQAKNLITFHFINPRSYCRDKHQQIDDQVYGGGAGMLIKAQPLIDAVEAVITDLKTKHSQTSDFKILFPSPAPEIFTQKHAYSYSKNETLIFVCGRYEGIDYRFEEYLTAKYPSAFQKISLGQFVLLGGEVATMTMIEAVSRLLPGVIKECESWQNESYALKSSMTNLEPPQYTRPETVYGYSVPEVLLTGNQKEIQQRQQEHSLLLGPISKS